MNQPTSELSNMTLILVDNMDIIWLIPMWAYYCQNISFASVSYVDLINDTLTECCSNPVISKSFKVDK